MSLAKKAKDNAKQNNKKITPFKAQMTNQQKHKVPSLKEKLQHPIVTKLRAQPNVKHLVITKFKESTKCEE
jgi:hypothetical protein